jgi:hypothetical protein
MRTLRSFFAVALTTLVACVQAQPLARVEPSPASGCLTAIDEKQALPEYPFVEYKQGKPGRVLVDFRFAGPTLRPEVVVVESSGGDAFVDAVKDQARNLRVPCMAADAEPVALRREYLFQPLRQTVDAGQVMDADAARRQTLLACVKAPADTPAYPQQALRQDLQGRVIGLLTFTSQDQAPAVQLLHRPSAASLTEHLNAWIAGYRLPCFVPGQDRPLLLEVEFVFRIGDSAFGFVPITLQQFLRATTNLGLRPLAVDTTTMGCPFELRLTYRQPSLRNRVASIGPYVAAREPLLEWLRGAALDLKSQTLDSIFGDTADIAVPCARLNIQPKEKS